MGYVLAVVLGVWYGMIMAFSTVTQESYEKAIDLCKPNLGIEKYVANVIGSAEVYCKNNARFKLKGSE